MLQNSIYHNLKTLIKPFHHFACVHFHLPFNVPNLCLILYIILQYLGGLNPFLSCQYGVGRSSVGKIIREMCNPIYDILCDEYLTLSMGIIFTLHF